MTHELVATNATVLLAKEGLLSAWPSLRDMTRIAGNDHSCDLPHAPTCTPVNTFASIIAYGVPRTTSELPGTTELSAGLLDLHSLDPVRRYSAFNEGVLPQSFETLRRLPGSRGLQAGACSPHDWCEYLSEAPPLRDCTSSFGT